MIAFAAVTGVFPKVGVVVVAILAAWAMLAAEPRVRAGAMLGALVLAPTLLLADIWDSPQLRLIHRQPALAAAIAVIALGAMAVVAVAIARRPAMLAPLAVLALPFRIPIEAGGTSSNLLVPLYLVVAAGSLAFIVPTLTKRTVGGTDEDAATLKPGLIERLLALYIVLYAIQALYSTDFEKALQQIVFFYVPFSLLFCLLRRLIWTPQLVRACMLLVVALALAFAAVGFVEYATKTLILNPKLVAANDVHAYFTVNSVFFDPDIFGRFLALVMIGLAVPLLYGRDRREQLGATVVLAILWGGLVLTLSRSSLAALLVGLGTLAALRWGTTRTLAAAGAVVAIGAIAIALTPKTFGLNQGLNGASSGRADLVSGGAGLFGDRPLWGYGAGSFVSEYRAQHPSSSQTLSASHTIPVTIAAEQGLIGELAYLALVLGAVVVLIGGARADPTRAGIAAAFLALLFHTLLYADFLEDPVTWTLLGVGSALALARGPERERAPVRPGAAAPVPA